MTKRSNYKDLGFIFGSIDELVPEDHLVRKQIYILKTDCCLVID